MKPFGNCSLDCDTAAEKEIHFTTLVLLNIVIPMASFAHTSLPSPFLPPHIDELRRQWRLDIAVCSQSGTGSGESTGNGSSSVDAAFDALVAAYGQPGEGEGARHYHTLAHVAAVLRALDYLLSFQQAAPPQAEAAATSAAVPQVAAVAGASSMGEPPSSSPSISAAAPAPTGPGSTGSTGVNTSSKSGRAVARLAGWYHDAVYNARAPSGANEEASALMAVRMGYLGSCANVS